jgi:hypothetical protein
MDTDLQQLMQYIGKNHETQMAAISDLGREFSEHKGRIEVRVTSVEDSVKDAKKWHNIKIIAAGCMVPLQIIARKFGVPV